jgi:hypothetical protein
MKIPVVNLMLATLGDPPVRFTDLAVEAEYDRQRGIAIVDGDAVTLLSRNGAPQSSQGTGPQPRSPRPARQGAEGITHGGRAVLNECPSPRTRLRTARSVVGISFQKHPVRVRVGLGPLRRPDDQRARGRKLVPVLISVLMKYALVCGEVHRECHTSRVP